MPSAHTRQQGGCLRRMHVSGRNDALVLFAVAEAFHSQPPVVTATGQVTQWVGLYAAPCRVRAGVRLRLKAFMEQKWRHAATVTWGGGNKTPPPLRCRKPQTFVAAVSDGAMAICTSHVHPLTAVISGDQRARRAAKTYWLSVHYWTLTGSRTLRVYHTLVTLLTLLSASRIFLAAVQRHCCRALLYYQLRKPRKRRKRRTSRDMWINPLPLRNAAKKREKIEHKSILLLHY